MKISKSVIPESWLPIMRIIEFIGVLVAIAVVLFDFIVDRPIDRATRNAQLLAQVAELATIEHANASGGIKAILEFLADEKVSMRGIALERTKLRGVDLERARLPFANLSRANLMGANLSRAELTDANLTGADLFRADLSGAHLAYANLTGANLANAKNLTQGQLDTACIGKGGKPPTLPEGLSPPQEVCMP